MLQDYLSKHDLNCHLELETLKGGLSGIRRSSKYGFLVYIDEMELDGDSKHAMTSTYDKCPDDYVQFGRDALFVTTNLSQKFCGSFERVSNHIGPESRLFAMKFSCAETGMGVTSRP